MQGSVVELGQNTLSTSRRTSAASSEEASGMLPLLSVAGNLQSGLSALESQIRQQLASLSSLLEKQSGGASSLIQLRLRQSQVGMLHLCLLW